MMATIGQDLAYLTTEHFRTIQGEKDLQNANPETVQELHRKVSDDMMLWIKDRVMMSDPTYKDLYTLLYTTQTFLKFDLIKDARDRWNQQIKEVFKPTPTRDGVRVGLRSLVDHVLRLYQKSGLKVPNSVLWKLCVDGNTIGNGQTAFALVPINLRKVFATQAVNSVFIFTVYKGPDNNDYLVANIGTTREEVEDLEKNGIEIDGKKIRMTFIHNSDLKALGNCSDLYDNDCICPFCSCTADERFNIRDRCFFKSKMRKIKDLFGVKRHMICCLHCKQRITEFYIKHMVQGDEDKMLQIEAAAHKIGLGNFKLIEKRSKWDDQIIGYAVKMLKGDECDVIIANYEVFIDAVSPDALERKLLRNAWYLFKEMVTKYLEGSSYDLENLDVKKLEDILDNWVLTMHAAFNMKESMPHYIHIIWAHLPDLLKEYGSLLPFSNQGFENSHQKHNRIWMRMVSKGGRPNADGKRVSPIYQLMQYFLRTVLMTIALPDAVWGKKYLNPQTEKKRRENREKKKEQKLYEKGISSKKLNDDDLDTLAKRYCDLYIEDNVKRVDTVEDVEMQESEIEEITKMDVDEDKEVQCLGENAITLSDSEIDSDIECTGSTAEKKRDEQPKKRCTLADRVIDYRNRLYNISRKSKKDIAKMFDDSTIKNLKISGVPKGNRIQQAEVLLKYVREPIITALTELKVAQLKSMKKQLDIAGTATMKVDIVKLLVSGDQKMKKASRSTKKRNASTSTEVPTTKRRKTVQSSSIIDVEEITNSIIVSESATEVNKKYSDMELVQLLELVKSPTRTHDTECVCIVFNIPVNISSFRRLLSMGWLNDELINAYLGILKRDLNAKDVTLFNTFFFAKLGALNKIFYFDAVSRWTKTVDIFQQNYLLVPVHLGTHWILVVVNMQSKTISIYDSKKDEFPQD